MVMRQVTTAALPGIRRLGRCRSNKYTGWPLRGSESPRLHELADLVRRESEFLLYAAPDGAMKVGVLFRDETAWLT